MNKTIVNRKAKNKALLLERFRKTPIVEVACQKIGIGRATYYRWRKEDPQFAKNSDEALHNGSLLVNDMAESQLLSAIKDKNMTAIIFWLKHHHPLYATKVEITATSKNQEINLTDEQKELLNKALEMASLVPEQKNLKDEQSTKNSGWK